MTYAHTYKHTHTFPSLYFYLQYLTQDFGVYYYSILQLYTKVQSRLMIKI